MSYNKLLNQYFYNNFNEDVICLFKQGFVTDSDDLGTILVNMNTKYQATQPASDFFIRIGMFGGAVSNASIGTRDNVRKRQPVSLRFNLYTPAGESNSKEIEIESVLDDLFLNLQLKSGDYLIQPDTATPKTVARIDSTGSAVWNDKSVTYRLIYEYY